VREKYHKIDHKTWFGVLLPQTAELTELTHVFRSEMKVRQVVSKHAEPTILPNPHHRNIFQKDHSRSYNLLKVSDGLGPVVSQ
jgi:hypothetical protein